MSYTIRSACIDDAETICSVLRRSITESCLLDHANNPQVLEGWLRNKTAANVNEWLVNPERYSFVAEQDEVLVGVAMASLAGEVLLCYAVAEVRFSGVGKAMLKAIEDQDSLLCQNTLRLASTKNALPFYKRNGFVITGEPKAVLGLEATPMSKKLCAG